MKLVKSLLLGAPAVLATMSVGQAADLPVRKAEPIAYVKICDAYGAGFFYIPGTDTCLKVGGYVRAEYQYTPTAPVFTLPSNSPSGGAAGAAYYSAHRQDDFGIRTRGRADLDARTQTAWGTVRTAMALRLQTQSGQYGGFFNGFGGNIAAPSLEAAFIQFAGFTAGRAGENFAFMPPFTWTGQHYWAGYPVGVKQLAYTATFGGGFSGTIAIEDRADFFYMDSAAFLTGSPNPVTGNYGFNYTPNATGGSYFTTLGGFATSLTYPNVSPALTGNLRVDQAWGAAQIMGTVGQNHVTTNTLPIIGGNAYDSPTFNKVGWAVGAGLKFNLPMLAAGDSLWLTAAYADGFIDQLQGANTNSNFPDSFQNSRGVFRFDQNMYIAADGNGGYHVGSTKGFSVGALLVHYWTPTLRSVFAGSFLHLTPPDFVRNADWTRGGLSEVNAYNLTGSLIWSPVANFDIGAEIQYRRINQSINCVGGLAGNAVASCAAFTNVASGGSLDRSVLGRASTATISPGTFDARLRVQRTF